MTLRRVPVPVPVSASAAGRQADRQELSRSAIAQQLRRALEQKQEGRSSSSWFKWLGGHKPARINNFHLSVSLSLCLLVLVSFLAPKRRAQRAYSLRM